VLALQPGFVGPPEEVFEERKVSSRFSPYRAHSFQENEVVNPPLGVQRSPHLVRFAPTPIFPTYYKQKRVFFCFRVDVILLKHLFRGFAPLLVCMCNPFSALISIVECLIGSRNPTAPNKVIAFQRIVHTERMIVLYTHFHIFLRKKGNISQFIFMCIIDNGGNATNNNSKKKYNKRFAIVTWTWRRHTLRNSMPSTSSDTWWWCAILLLWGFFSIVISKFMNS
jgi:hypothetical protein